MPIIATGVDLSYAGARMDYANVKRKGYVLAARYLGNDSRCLTVQERNKIHSEGLRLAVIGQRGAVDRPRGGYAAGREDGLFFDDWANRMGVPLNKPILCAVADVGNGFPTTNDLPAIKEFFRGLWESIRRPVGIYGPYWVLEAFRGDGRVFCFWQSAGGSGSGQGTGGQAFNQGDGSWRRLSSMACMYQEYGSVAIDGTDHNQVYMDPREFTWHPDDTDDPEQPEENYDMKAVFTPDQTGGIGWRTFTSEGKRWREGYQTRESLDVDLATGLVDGEITLHGSQGALFLANYPEKGYDGPRLFSTTGDTTWGRDVAGLAPGQTGRFYLAPNSHIIAIHDQDQWNADRFVGIPEVNMAEPFLWNQPLVPWRSVFDVNVDLSDVEVDASITTADKTEIAKMTAAELSQRLES